MNFDCSWNWNREIPLISSMLASSAIKSVKVHLSSIYFTCVRAYDLLNSKRNLFNWTCRDISICRSSSPSAMAQNTFLCQLHKLKYILLNRKHTQIFSNLFSLLCNGIYLLSPLRSVCQFANTTNNMSLYAHIGLLPKKLTLSQLSML